MHLLYIEILKTGYTTDMKKFLYVFLILAVAMIIYFARSLFQPKKTVELHYHAGFEIYKDGTRMDFTALEFMNVKPCADDEKSDHADTQPEVHLHDGIGDIVHVHGKVATWNDLFLKLHLDAATASAFINNKPISHVGNAKIQSYDQAVIFVNTPKNQKELISKSMARIPVSYIKNIENKSENCSTHP